MSKIWSFVLKDICSAISSTDVSVTVTRELHLELNELIDAMLLKDGLQLDGCCYMIFDTLLNILSMATDEDILSQVNLMLMLKENWCNYYPNEMKNYEVLFELSFLSLIDIRVFD